MKKTVIVSTCFGRSLLAVVSAVALSLVGSSSAVAQSIGVNYVSTGNGVVNTDPDSLTPSQVAGAFPQANWNNLGRYGGSVVLTNSAGVATTITNNWDASSTAHTGTAALGTPDGQLMDSYLYCYSTGSNALGNSVYGTSINDKPLVYLSGLNSWYHSEGAEGYAIALYINGYTYYEHSQRWIQAVSGNPLNNTMVGGADLTPHLFDVCTGNFAGTYIKVSPNSTSDSAATYGANYEVFTGLTNDAILIRNNAAGYGMGVNGFQIIPLFPTAPTATAPTIAPSATVFAGVPVTITEVASGDPFNPATFYQWQSDNGNGGPVTNNILNATNTTYSFTPTNNSSTYTLNFQVVVTNSFGSTTSSVVTLTVNPAVPPYVTQDTTPGAGNGATNVLAYIGGLVSFNAAFAGPIPITNHWQLNTGTGFTNLPSASIPSATNNTLNLTNNQLVAGNYQYQASNQFGQSNSTPTTLLLLADPAAPNATQPYAYDIFTNSPVAYWRLAETNDTVSISMQAYDYSGHAHNGTYGNGSADNIPGPQSPTFPGFEANNTGAAFLNGFANSYVSVPPVNLNTNTVTITAWIQPGTVVGTFWGLFMNRNGNDAAGLGFGGAVSNGIAELGYTWNSNSPSTYGFHSGLYPPANTWSFVALTITPTNATIYLCYIDPVSGNTNLLKAVNPVTNMAEAFSGGTTRIGSDNADNRSFQGTVDEVAVFNQAFTSSQIYSLFSTALGTQIAPTITLNPSPAVLNAFAGQTEQLHADGAGVPDVTYQWQAGSGGVFHNLVNGGRVSGATSSTLTIMTTSADALDYQLVIANSVGSATSSVETLALTPVPTNGLWTVNFAVVNGANGTSVTPYSGPGILGTGSFWNALTIPGSTGGYRTAGAVYQDDGTTANSVVVSSTMFNAGYGNSSGTGTIPLLGPYAEVNGNTLQFGNIPNGTYNLALFGVDGNYRDQGAIFTVNGVTQSTTGGPVNQFISGVNSVLYTSVTASGGVLSMTASNNLAANPSQSFGAFNGAQLQLVQAIGNPATIGSATQVGGNLVIKILSPDVGQSFRILSATNITQAMSTWIPVATNTFTGLGYTNTLPVSVTKPQSYYRIVEP